ncbi:PKD domain-containing protein [Myxococcus llanfairpwllgwyngyllgogerychwyrndrobwllllantysiliogogogochensis]|uniref:PKD domain-containing protein n=1 Tax=Myxococcus llanfairpwllgwyngyllgogerychwyrndrobwllllantysiliogogogochensis TaxID=2590453 RepID=A0A540WTV6_9BACT|nr:metallophosphoesterase [Myxococcus llanfairpwllgwyngyllgogerychwyrndrobwllllantysiliogogogochensis]TQF12433.1 PKD domain-containing protein [Myxococcus llanfairpwllgwyngyllgogerychwyrndrobwllllantysiliogogogochensis]
MHRKTRFNPLPLAVALTLVSAVASAGVLARDPYLQKVGPDTALVAFRLAANCSPEVRYGVGAVSEVARSEASGRVHAVVLTGLKPSTEYSYEVSACGLKTPTKRFTTAPEPGTRSVHFAAVGDFGTGGSDQKAVAADMLARKPELFVALGDNAYPDGTEADFQDHLFAPMAALLAEVPLFASPGNHEYVTNQGQPYLDNLYMPTNNPAGSERYFSFDWGHVHFVSLDSNCAIGLSAAERCSLADQKAWLQTDLAGTTQPWKVVFFHHPPWSSGEHGSQLTMRRQFGPIFEKYGVDLVLTGHDHNYERSKPMQGDGVASSGGIPYLVVGGGGAALRAFSEGQPSWSQVRDNKAHGFLDVEVVEGVLTAKLITTDDTVLDSFTLHKDLPPVEQPPPADALSVTVEGERGVAPHRALFRATTSSVVPVSWDFGDGGAAQGTTAEHTYAKAGQYTVTATATFGAVTRTATSVVTVSAAPGGGGGGEDGGSGGGTDAGTPSTGNPDDRPSPPTTGTPSTDDEGGGSGGGCAAGPTAALLPAAGLMVAGLLRRRRASRRP